MLVRLVPATFCRLHRQEWRRYKTKFPILFIHAFSLSRRLLSGRLRSTMIGESVRLFEILPAFLKLVWAALLIGLVLCGIGYFAENRSMSMIGGAVLIAGYGAATVDVFFRKKHRSDAALFHTGLVVAPILSSLASLILALLTTLMLVVVYFVEGSLGWDLLRVVHFVALIFAFLSICGIPRLAFSANAKARSDTD